MSEVENAVDTQPEQHKGSHGEEEHKEVGKNALIFALLYMLLVVALWGYVYLTLLERGMTQ